MKVKSKSEVAQSCPTLCDPMDCSLAGSSARGIFQARVLKWVSVWDLTSLVGKMGEGDGTPLQYFCLENPMDGGAW